MARRNNLEPLPVLIYDSLAHAQQSFTREGAGRQETKMHNGQNSRYQLRMRLIAANSQKIPPSADRGCSARHLHWKTFLSRRIVTERVGFACAIREEEDAKVTV